MLYLWAMSRSITLFLDPDPGLTLKTLYDICIHAEENHKELRGIQPLQRVEAGLGIPKNPGDEGTYYKAQLRLGWNRGHSHAQYCRWNLYIPDNWKDELPRHRLFNASVNKHNVCIETKGGWMDRMKEMGEKADAFARCQGEGIDMRWNKIIVTLDCNGCYRLPPKMFKALKDTVTSMGLCNKPVKVSQTWRHVMKEIREHQTDSVP